MPLESDFKTELIAEIERQYPGAITLKIHAGYRQGILDNFIIWEDRWAAFEAKRSRTAPKRPNQEYYVRLLNKMSFASFVYPENRKEFLYELQQTFRPKR